MTTLTASEINLMMSQLQRALRVTAVEANDLAAAFGKTTDQINEYEKEAKSFIKGENEIAKQRRRQYAEAKKQHEDAMRILEQRAAAEQKAVLELQVSQLKLVDVRRRQQELAARKNSMDQIDYANQSAALAQQRREAMDEVAINRMKKNQAVASVKDAEANQQKLQAVLARNSQQLTWGGNMMYSSLAAGSKLVSSGITKLLSAFSVQQGVSDVYRGLLKQIDTGVSTSVENMLVTSGQFGMTLEEYTATLADNRRSLLSVGGLDSFNKTLLFARDQFKDSIGDVADRARYAAEQLTILSQSGIRPTQNDLANIGYSFKSLSKLTGMTGAQFNAHLSDILDDEMTRNKLRAASSEAERRSIIEGTARQLEMNVSLGMTVEQAKLEAKALNRLAGESPIDRIKKAARLRALGGAMGIEGGEEAANIMIKGQRATAEEQRRLQDFLSKASNQLSAAGTGSLGGEIFATTLVDKLNLKDTLDPFNTRLAEPLQASAESLKSIENKNGQTAQTVVSTLNQLAGWLKSPIVNIGGGLGAMVIQGATSLIGTGIESLVLSKLLPKMMTTIPASGAATGGAAAGAGAGAAGAGLMARMLPMLGTTAGVVGAGAVGYGIGTLINNAIGDNIASVIHKVTGLDDKTKAALAPTPINPRAKLNSGEPATDNQPDPKAIESTIKTATTADKMVTEQVETNTLLESLVGLTEQQVDVAKRLLATSTLSDEERKNLTQSSMN